MLVTDVDFSSRTRKGKGQQGSGLHTSIRPILRKLKDYENICTYDLHVKSSINILVNAVVGSLGEVEHSDPDIQAFLRYNVAWLYNEQGIDFYDLIKSQCKTALWAGFSVGENLYTVDKENATLVLSDIVNYHPSTIFIRTNMAGRLTEGELSPDGMRSGIYQTGSISSSGFEVPLSINKVTHLVHDKEFSNYYGRSILEGVYRWHVLKEAIVDMMTVALDKFGNPLIAITLPNVGAGTSTIDPTSGEERVVSTQELLEQQLQGMTFGQGNVIILPQIDANLKPEVKVITTGNNVGSMYQDAFTLCERQQSKGLLVPFGLIAPTENADGRALEKQIEIFNRIVKEFYGQLVRPAIRQAFQRLIKYNFNRASANLPPSFPITNNSNRPEDRVSLMQMIKGLTSDGFLNPTNEQDWAMVRQMVNANPRPQEPDDVEFIKQLIIYPRQPESLDGAPTPKKKGTSNPDRDRTLEGKVNGAGQRGRPAGISTPHLNP